ncbi:sensor histidine kinase [Fulvimarina endophytica]|uniref:histidine kinase n=1 Tax=Fulvimarina endophytica TaxID=2293836 RepID=A0A371X4H7_9HYPH|nr:HAMP domain-containing sensor histidine kinase [Fulvimarina endophytica]RFC64138.1 sensor histidine kinase [Fulvimarina endophytica]
MTEREPGASPLRARRAGRSLKLRLVAIAAGLILATLAGAGSVLTRGLSDFVTERYRTELREDLLSLVGSVRVSPTGALTLPDPPSDARFLRPLSGWYWQVGFAGSPVLSSPSLAGARLDAEGGTGPNGEALLVLSRSVPTPEFGEPLEVLVTAPQAEIDGAVGEAIRPLTIAFLFLGIGLTAMIALQVHLGLKPLSRLTADLRRVRAGERADLPPQSYREIAPLAEEINALLIANRSVVGRARDHLADLSHALKTPLSVVRNALERHEPAGGSGLPAARLMERVIERRLGRARAEARRRNGAAPVGPVVDDILLVLRPIIEARRLQLETMVSPNARFAGDPDDLAEMIGPLGENACTHARGRLRLEASVYDGVLAITVDDDGPGMSAEDAARALKRGERLDETLSGSGLGLAIAQDLARLYGGSLSLGPSPAGGLRARLDLPAA